MTSEVDESGGLSHGMAAITASALDGFEHACGVRRAITTGS